ncbi:Pka-R2 [Symbiodinium natans]|uniref:Pka-R2 protein n=1 Tax=Symbiodinium natans TaxID=878477 RepID=A0A812QJT3_9DINO|nr:Pka-R2 [Symbiodinium natans]
MAQVECRFTFLDVLLEDEERGRDLHAGRARSAPPPLCLESLESPWSLEEAAVRSYVRSLPTVFAGPEVPRAVPVVPAPASAGSMGHPELCQRPCVHVAAGRNCEEGDACGFCHVPHSHAHKMDKRQRRIIQEMPKADFLHLALQLLKDKAETMQHRGTEVLFGILETEMHSEGTSVPEMTTPSRLPRALMRCMREASFSTVVGWAARKCTDDARIQLYGATQTLRNQATL